MKKLSILLLAIFSALCLFSVARAAEKEDDSASTEIPKAIPVEKEESKAGFFDRIFKKHTPTPTPESQPAEQEAAQPTPTPPTRRAEPKKEEVEVRRAESMENLTKKAIPTEHSETVEPKESPTPTPRRKPRPKAKPTPTAESTPEPKPTPTPKTTPTPEPTPVPKSSPEPQEAAKKEPESSALEQPIPFVPTPEPAKPKKPQGPDILDPNYEQQIREKYAEVKAKALEDPEVLKLKETADAAFDPKERSKALKSYYEALFDQMRKLDPDMKSQIDRREETTLRRIDSIAP